MARRSYAGGAPVTELAAGITAGSASFTVAAGGGAGYPTGANGPFFVALDEETANEEKALVSNRTGDVFTFAGGGRGADDTTAVSHTLPCTVRHVYTATDADEANQHVNTNAAVHGTTSAVMGLTDVQTPTNKTIDGNDNTFANIPLSAVLFAAGWETALGTILGSNWANAFDTALGSNWTTAFANVLGATWTDALDTALGAGWPTELALAVEGALVHTTKTQTLTNKTINDADNTLSVDQGSLQRGVLNLNGDGTAFNIGAGAERARTTLNTAANVGGFTRYGNTAEWELPLTGLYLVLQEAYCSSTNNNADEEFLLRVRRDADEGQDNGTIIAEQGGNFNTAGNPEAFATMADVVGPYAAGTRLRFTILNSSGATITESGASDRKHVGLIFLGPGS